MIRWLLDLAVVALLAVLAGAAMVSFDGLLRIALVLPMILFVPGYAFISALFPEESSLSRSRRSRRPWGASEQGGRSSNPDESFLLGNIERFALSIAISLAIVALIVFGLNFTVGFDARRIAVMLFGFTGSMIIFAIARRIVLPAEERFTIDFATGFPMDTTFVGMFALSLLILVASVGAFAVMSPTGQPDTGFFVIAENESTGDMSLKAGDKAISEGRPATIMIKNREGSTQRYSAIIVQQSVENGEVTDSETIERFTPTVEDGKTKRIEFEPPDEGDKLMLYLYKGNVEEPSQKTAYKTLRYSLSSSSSSSDDSEESIAPAPSLVAAPGVVAQGSR